MESGGVGGSVHGAESVTALNSASFYFKAGLNKKHQERITKHGGYGGLGDKMKQINTALNM